MDKKLDKPTGKTLEELINAVLEFDSDENKNLRRLAHPDLSTKIWQNSASKSSSHWKSHSPDTGEFGGSI